MCALGCVYAEGCVCVRGSVYVWEDVRVCTELCVCLCVCTRTQGCECGTALFLSSLSGWAGNEQEAS